MKKRQKYMLFIICILLACTLWQYHYGHRKAQDNLPALSALQEEKLAELKGFQKAQLEEVWQHPAFLSEKNGEETAVWILPDGRQLSVMYDRKGYVIETEVAAPPALSAPPA